MAQGKIRVQTENIFPIIKKFLYNEQDIFIRELISNATDAIQKLKTLSGTGEQVGSLDDLKITVTVNKEAKTITIDDNGIGMSEEEVDKYINQVAFSGAEEFLEKYKGQNEANIIGHFGLGFYSAFMVSKQVEIITKSYKDVPAVHWTCDGSPEYSIVPSDKTERGTSIILHLNEESESYLEDGIVKQIIIKFGKFMAVPIYMDGTQVNNTSPIWVKKPADLTDDDYINFYKELYPFSETPLFWIHLNVDYPFNLTGVLYFPKIKHSYEVQKDKIQLYCNQVYVTDEVKDIVPEFLMLLHGVIDSPDIPLNVSRSYLQGDPNVKKINSHITKKVADKLEEIYKKDKESYIQKWESLGLFVKYGMMTEDKFIDKGNKILLMEDVADGKLYAWEELKEKMASTQKDKDGKITVIYTSQPDQQAAYIKAAQDKAYIVVKLDHIIDNGFISQMEIKWDDVKFVRVDSDIADHLVDVQEASDSALDSEQVEAIKSSFALTYEGLNLDIQVKGLSPDALPITASRSEMMRRMKEMAEMGGGMASFYGQMPDQITITINGNHKVITDLAAMKDEEAKKSKVQNLCDLALLSLGALNGKALVDYVNRNLVS